MADIFVEMVKDGEHLVVHPSTVKSHQRAGWIVVGEVTPTVPKPPIDEKPTDESVKPNHQPAKAKK